MTRSKAGKTAEQLADELDSHQDELSEREQKMKDLLNNVQEQNRKYDANESMFKKEFDGLVKEIESLKYVHPLKLRLMILGLSMSPQKKSTWTNKKKLPKESVM